MARNKGKKQGKKTEKPAQKPGLRRDFERVASYPEITSGRPFLKDRFDLNLPLILKMFREGRTDKEVGKRFDLTPDDVLARRAYHFCLLAQNVSPADAKKGKRVFLLDENLPRLLVPDVVRLFGQSSHVLAEGLYGKNNDDEKHIWAHMVNHKYQAIMTRDAAFQGIARRYRKKLIDRHGSLGQAPEHVPAVVQIVCTGSRQDILNVITKHCQEIRDHIARNDKPFMIANIDRVSCGDELIAPRKNKKRKTGRNPAP